MASGNGTNAQSLLQFAQNNTDKLDFKCVVSDNFDAYVLERARKLKVSGHVIPFRRSANQNLNEAKRYHETEILDVLEALDVEWVFLAGYMRILSKYFLSKLYDGSLGVSKVVNVHPALLPSFAGRNAYRQVFESGVKVSGVTIHFVDDGIDTGPIIAQRAFDRLQDDSYEQFVARGKEVEHQLYTEVLSYIMDYRINVERVKYKDFEQNIVTIR